MKTGDAISPPSGYVGGGLQMQVNVGIGPAGDVWVTGSAGALERVDEALSIRSGGLASEQPSRCVRRSSAQIRSARKETAGLSELHRFAARRCRLPCRALDQRV